MSVAERLAAITGSRVTDLVPLHGGDLSEVRAARLADGRTLVVKTGATVAAEARMLRAIAPHAPAPAVLHDEPGLILLEHLHETRESGPAWATLGRDLRALHQHEGSSYGWPEDHAFGPVTIHNAACADWPEFWAQRRLLPLAAGLPRDLRARVERLCARLPDLLPRAPRASLLHGDLWSGNLLFTARRAYLIDPASYVGHAEVDLAMLTLFGRPPAEFWRGYGALDTGADARRPLYQLWPALVHYRLFGTGYRAMVADRLTRCGV